ncbi:MAG: DUF11 domain-containing protein, partial [Chloroflexota bacterium]
MSKALAARRPVAAILGTILLIAALLGAAGAFIAVRAEGSPSVTTDKPDYSPYETAIISGTGFEPYALLDIPVIQPDGTIVKGDGNEEPGWDSVQADESGNFVYYYLVGGMEGTYTVEVYPSPWGGPGSGEVPLATTTFTDCPYYHIYYRAADPDTYGTYFPPGPSSIPGEDYSTSVTSLAPKELVLGQIVVFYVKLEATDRAPSSQSISYKVQWCTKTTSGGDFGYDESYGVINAFVDTGDSHYSGDLSESVSYSWSIDPNGCGSGNPAIVGQFTVSDVDRYEAIVVDMWLVLEDQIPPGTSGNVQSKLLSAKEEGTGRKISVGVQTVPLQKVQEFFDYADLEILKSDNPDPVTQGQTLTYTITVNNVGAATATSVVVTDVLDANTLYLSDTDSCVEGPTGTLTCSLGDIAASGSVSFDIVVQVAPGAPVGTDTLLNSASVSTTATEPNLGNNEVEERTSVEAAVQEADVKITGQEIVDPPTEMAVSADTPITLRKTLHNNGPFGPVDVSISPSGSAPPDCTATPDPANPSSASLPVSTDVVVDEVWTIHCDKPSSHSFSFNNSIAITTPNVEDPNPANNSASTNLTVAVGAQADVRIVDQHFLSPPTEMPVSNDTPVTLRKVLHNNGPYPDDVTVSVDRAATAPDGCTITPTTVSQQVALPMSTDVTLDELFTIHCSQASSHTFTIDNTVSGPKEPHITDPNLDNNSGS